MERWSWFRSGKLPPLHEPPKQNTPRARDLSCDTGQGRSPRRYDPETGRFPDRRSGLQADRAACRGPLATRRLAPVNDPGPHGAGQPPPGRAAGPRKAASRSTRLLLASVRHRRPKPGGALGSLPPARRMREHPRRLGATGCCRKPQNPGGLRGWTTTTRRIDAFAYTWHDENPVC